MRIIAGEFRGRELLGPKSDRTRPITDRAKQSLFDALAVAVDLTGATILDCFCGTGSMGLESLSRGAARAIFVEQDRAALAALGGNIDRLGVRDRCRVLSQNAYRLPMLLQSGEAAPVQLQVAFVDPPYAHMENPRQRGKIEALITALAGAWMRPDGLMIVRHPTAVALDAPVLAPLVVRRLQYGSMGVTWLAPQGRKNEG